MIVDGGAIPEPRFKQRLHPFDLRAVRGAAQQMQFQRGRIDARQPPRHDFHPFFGPQHALAAQPGAGRRDRQPERAALEPVLSQPGAEFTLAFRGIGR